MAEYIDRLKLLKEMHGSHTLPFFIGHRTDEDIMFCQMLDIVQEQPTADVVEVVRCKDCKHRDKSGLCQAEGQKLTIVKDNHFCAKGERRSE